MEKGSSWDKRRNKYCIRKINLGLGNELKIFLLLVFKGLVWTLIFWNITQNGEGNTGSPTGREPPYRAGVPKPLGPWTGTGPHPVRNWAAQQMSSE